jgi:hypothetical protein
VKELTLNPDGTLDIINPTKCFIAKTQLGTQKPIYWQCIKLDNGCYGFVSLRRENLNAIDNYNHNALFSKNYIQYSCQRGLEFLGEDRNYRGYIYQFDSKEEFIQCQARGEL